MPIEINRTGSATTEVEVNKEGKQTRKRKTERVTSRTTKALDASVSFGAGQTQNLGNFNSVKVFVSVTLPSHHTKTELNKTYKTAFDWVDQKLDDVMKRIGGDDDDDLDT